MHPKLSRDVIEQLVSQVVECAPNGGLARFLSEYRAAVLPS
jgi:hypothetical protein